jgi:hypothetical protein
MPEIEVGEGHIARLEIAVEHLQTDMAEVKAVLGRLEPRISEMFGAFPHLATKADVAAVKVDVAKRPTIAGIMAIVAVIAAIASVPIWPA